MKTPKIELLAKPYQTLKGHLVDSVLIFKFLCQKEESFFKTIYKKLIVFNEENKRKFFPDSKFEYKDMVEILLIIVYFHDIGKASDIFQDYIKIKRGEQSKRKQFISHSYSSFYLLILILLKKNYCRSYEFLGNLLIYSLFSVLGHHGQLNNNSFQSSLLQKEQKFLKSDIKEIISDFFNVYENVFGFNLTKSIFLPINSFDNNSDIMKIPNSQDGIKIDVIVQSTIANIKNVNKIENHEIVFIKYWFGFCYSLLKFCDEFASQIYQTKEEFLKKKFKDEGTISGQIILKIDDLKNFIKKEKIEFFYKSYHDIVKSNPILPSSFFLNELQQKIKNKTSKNVLIRLGCGMGKTAAALFYAKNISKTRNFSRIIFTLPTQFTSNSIVDDLVKQNSFITENIGLFHGNAEEFWENYFKLEENDILIKEDEEFLESQKKSTQKIYSAKVFNFPITITTVDHLILSFIHGFKQADKSLINILHSIVIFDELHYYEHHTLEIILELQNILREWDIPHLIMSGTMPDKILEYYKEKDYKILDWNGKFELKDGNNEDRIPYALKLIINPLFLKKDKNFYLYEEFQVLILKNSRKIGDLYLKQIIFVNTVERTKILYDLLINLFEYFPNKPKLIVYHSQFTKKDKIKKETIIKENFTNAHNNRPIILITTQISEFSLNISSDIMYSEIAPLDGLFQRAGRLHRAGFRTTTKECLKMSGDSCYGACKRCLNFRNYQDLKYTLYVFLPENFPLEIINSKENFITNLNQYKNLYLENEKKGKKTKIYWSNPYSFEVLLNSIIYLHDKIGFEYYKDLTFKDICTLVSKLYKNMTFADSVSFKECFRNNAIFGDKPAEILFGSNPKITIRPQKYLVYYVVPFHFRSSDNIEDFSIPISFAKYKKIEKKFRNFTSDKGFFVMPPEIQYSSKIGFDFSPLMD